MTYGLQLVLLLFALFGYGGAGTSMAVARYRRMSDGERDLGMFGVAVLLLLFGALCTAVAVGISGVFAFGGVTVWAGYVFMAQHLGLFQVEANPPASARDEPAEETRPLE